MIIGRWWQPWRRQKSLTTILWIRSHAQQFAHAIQFSPTPKSCVDTT